MSIRILNNRKLNRFSSSHILRNTRCLGRNAQRLICYACSFAIVLLTAAVANGASQTFVLQSGWNLITFQVLPQDKTPRAVFAALVSESGGSLYTNDSATNKLRAVYTAKRTGAALTWEGLLISAPPGQPPSSSSSPPAIDLANAGNLALMEFGRGYYVFLQNLSADSTFTIEGDQSPAGSGLSFAAGWNLVGVTGNLPQPTTVEGQKPIGKKINVHEIFRQADLEKIISVARWNAAKAEFQYYFPREAERSGFQLIEPNYAYWVQTNTALEVRPDMVVHAPGDSDLPPLAEPPVVDNQAWSPGPEDVSLNLPGTTPIFHTKESQEFLLAGKGQNTLRLPLYNRGGGILGWKAILEPYLGTAPGSAVRLATANDVRLVLSLKRDRGITTSEADGVEILVDRTHLVQGTYLAKVRVESDTGQRSKDFTLIIDVGGLEGQWNGTATIDTVNGKKNPVADIDLVLHLFKDNIRGSGQLRGMVDGQETLLWPMDASVMGHIADFPSPDTVADPDFMSRFVISGGYTLPPGDTNKFPFENFPNPAGPAPATAVDPDTGLRYLTNAEGDRFYVDLADRISAGNSGGGAKQPNFTNPLNKFVSREVEFIGQMSGTDISQGGADVLTGEYYETITGMLPQAIQLRGHFRLVRKGYTPFERRPFPFFYEGPPQIPVGGRSINSSQTFGEPSAEKISVNTHLLIHRLVVVVAHDLDDVRHTLTLTGPNNSTVTLHRREKVGESQFVVYDSGDQPLKLLELLAPPELRGAKPLPTATAAGLDVLKYETELRNSLSKYVVRRPRQSLASFNDIDAFGDWRLKLTNHHTVARNMLGWSLLIYGVPVNTLNGRVVVEGSDDPQRFSDVELQITGLNANLGGVLTTFDRNTGAFSISHLPSIRINVVANKPGYPPATIDNLNTAADPRGYRDGLFGIVPGDHTLITPGVGVTSEFTITLRQPPNSGDQPAFDAFSFVGGTSLNFQAARFGRVNAYPRLYSIRSAGGSIIVDNLKLMYQGSLPAGVTESQIRWQFDGEGAASLTTLPAVVSGRSPQVRLAIPEANFTAANNYMVALKPTVLLGGPGNEVAFDDWVVVVLANPPPDAVSPNMLLQGSPLTGFGAFPGSDPEKFSFNAQKTDVSKVDVDRPPFINPGTNPTFNFELDGFSEPGGGEGEDTNLHPRSFTVHRPNQNGKNNNAYAEMSPTADTDGFLFTKLVPPLAGTVPVYDDRNKGVEGRDINARDEPVRIFTAIGDRVIDQCVTAVVGGQQINRCGSASDGRFRISAGTNPGTTPRTP